VIVQQFCVHPSTTTGGSMMAESKKPGGSQHQRSEPAKELREDPFIENLVPDPSKIQGMTVFVGLLGKSARAGYWRLYLTMDLNEYVEFSQDDVAHSQPLPKGQSALGGTMVWVKKEATLQYTRTVSRQVQAEFLQGDISAQFSSGGADFLAAMMPGQGHQIGPASRLGCPTRDINDFNCRSNEVCPSIHICRTDRCPTETVRCASPRAGCFG
jgi:hypothetical protein